MLVLGLTGSIGMGKSNAAAVLRRLRVPVHDADATVHSLLAPGGAAVPEIAKAFPEAVVGEGKDARVDRARLAGWVFGEKAALRRLEAIVHPLVRQETARFLKAQARRRTPLVCLDIPLLYETGAERRCDLVVLVTAPRWLQRERVLRRPGMTPERLAAILDQQMPDAEKRKRADVIIQTGLGKGHTLRRLRSLVRLLRGHPDEWRHRGRRPKTRF